MLAQNLFCKNKYQLYHHPVVYTVLARVDMKDCETAPHQPVMQPRWQSHCVMQTSDTYGCLGATPKVAAVACP